MSAVAGGGGIVDPTTASADTEAVPTVLFVHGAAGAPNQFAALASFLRDRANTAAFLYDDSARLVESADLLRRELLRFSGRLLIVAHSMGALLVLKRLYTSVFERPGRVQDERWRDGESFSVRGCAIVDYRARTAR